MLNLNDFGDIEVRFQTNIDWSTWKSNNHYLGAGHQQRYPDRGFSGLYHRFCNMILQVWLWETGFWSPCWRQILFRWSETSKITAATVTCFFPFDPRALKTTGNGLPLLLGRSRRHLRYRYCCDKCNQTVQFLETMGLFPGKIYKNHRFLTKSRVFLHI